MIKAVNYDTIYINIKRLFFIFQQCFCGFLGFTEIFAVPSLCIGNAENCFRISLVVFLFGIRFCGIEGG
jgi:hypothetical protein